MTHVVTGNRINCKHTDGVGVYPVDCLCRSSASVMSCLASPAWTVSFKVVSSMSPATPERLPTIGHCSRESADGDRVAGMTGTRCCARRGVQSCGGGWSGSMPEYGHWGHAFYRFNAAPLAHRSLTQHDPGGPPCSLCRARGLRTERGINRAIDAVQGVDDALRRALAQRIVDRLRLATGRHQTVLAQYREMLRQRRLTQVSRSS